jgi:hypothetical protein
LRSVVVPRQAWEGVPCAEVADLRSRRAEPAGPQTSEYSAGSVNYSRLFTGCSLRSVSDHGPHRSGATEGGRFPLPIPPLAPSLAPRWRTASAEHIWITIPPGERIPACASARRCIRLSDCLRAVHLHSDNNFGKSNIPGLPAPRPRLERGTYCLGGTFDVSPSSARCRLTCRLAILAAAGRGLTWPRIWGRWLPVRLSAISLARLMFNAPDRRRYRTTRPAMASGWPG